MIKISYLLLLLIFHIIFIINTIIIVDVFFVIIRFYSFIVQLTFNCVPFRFFPSSQKIMILKDFWMKG